LGLCRDAPETTGYDEFEEEQYRKVFDDDGAQIAHTHREIMKPGF
jgi:hypothetical protein